MEEETVIGSPSLTQLKSTLRRKFGKGAELRLEVCPTCAAPLAETGDAYEYVRHNPETCRLVNLALFELGVEIRQTVRINIYPGAGPLRGFYFTGDPYTIHVSEEAYARLREYIIFHETKHLVDCLEFGRSEELTPDRFARSLCVKYGYGCPPENYSGPWSAYA